MSVLGQLGRWSLVDGPGRQRMRRCGVDEAVNRDIPLHWCTSSIRPGCPPPARR